MSYYYEEIISNEYLGVTKLVKARTLAELDMKIENQLQAWEKREDKERQRQLFADMKAQAEYDTEQALEEIESYRNMLNHTLTVNDKLQWEELYDREEFKPFVLDEDEPSFKQFERQFNIPDENKLIELIFPPRKKKRLELIEKAKTRYEIELEQYKIRKENALKEYEKEKELFIKKQNSYNHSIDEFKQKFESGDREAIEEYLSIVLEHSIYPDAISKEFDVQYEQNSETAIVDYNLPNPDDVPKIIEYKFVQSRKETTTKEMKKKEFETYFEDIILQVTLRTVHEIFESVYTNKIQSVVFNGWVQGIDPSTGKDFNSCIISLQVSKGQFEEINLARINPKDCFKNLKGIIAGPLNQLAPVRPIMQIKKDDIRFVESREIMAEVNSIPNLAQMDWEDFEHLVRELFSKIFTKDGGEVQVTRASRDGGVDAIAFDNDPIRGGKYVIQAKRYNNVVPVSAVRDLYGTMINEGAVKGILVTTSYFGNDSRDFVKDKPISLIDGSNLVHMFQEHGHNVRIQLSKRN